MDKNTIQKKLRALGIGRFQVMALLQAARHYIFKYVKGSKESQELRAKPRNILCVGEILWSTQVSIQANESLGDNEKAEKWRQD